MTTRAHSPVVDEVGNRHAQRHAAAIVQTFLGYFSRGDVPRAFDLLAAEATWWVAGAVPGLSGTRSSNEFRTMLELLSEDAVGGAIELTPTGWTVSSHRVAVEALAHAEFHDGRIYLNEYHFVFTIDGDRISSVKAYLDTEKLRDTFLHKGVRAPAETEG